MKAGIVLCPVANPILRPEDAVTAGSVVLERQGVRLPDTRARPSRSDRPDADGRGSEAR